MYVSKDSVRRGQNNISPRLKTSDKGREEDNRECESHYKIVGKYDIKESDDNA